MNQARLARAEFGGAVMPPQLRVTRMGFVSSSCKLTSIIKETRVQFGACDFVAAITLARLYA